MPKITFISAHGAEHTVDVQSGISAMEAAVQNMVEGIDGDCGGLAACATCHVHVDPSWTDKTGPATEGVEAEMLSLADNVSERSRLACQIRIDETLDGLVLQVPEHQH